MIVVTVDLHSAKDGHQERLGTVIIGNDGTGGRRIGNYNIYIGKRGQADLRKIYAKPWKRGRVEGYPRTRLHPLYLVRRALAVMGEERP